MPEFDLALALHWQAKPPRPQCVVVATNWLYSINRRGRDRCKGLLTGVSTVMQYCMVDPRHEMSALQMWACPWARWLPCTLHQLHHNAVVQATRSWMRRQQHAPHAPELGNTHCLGVSASRQDARRADIRLRASGVAT